MGLKEIRRKLEHCETVKDEVEQLKKDVGVFEGKKVRVRVFKANITVRTERHDHNYDDDEAKELHKLLSQIFG